MRNLDRAPGNIRRLTQEAMRRIAEQFAEYVKAELREQHIRGRSLYGKKYPQPQSGGDPMHDTGVLMDGYQVEPVLNNSMLSVRNVVDYSQFLTAENKHQHLPERNKMPPKWQKKLDSIKKTEMKRFYRELGRTLGLKGTISL